jgi:hypothetical protein
LFECHEQNVKSMKYVFEIVMIKHLMTVMNQIEIELICFVRPSMTFDNENPWLIMIFNVNNNIWFAEAMECPGQSSIHGYISELSAR